MSKSIICFVWLLTPFAFAFESVIEQQPIRYSETAPDTPITDIAARIADGEKLLTGATRQEVLLELLDLLDVPVESQVLVYSKTSAQNSLIAPEHPRALYFSENAYVGWVQRGNIEVITFDERLGAVFHMLHLSDREEGDAPKIVRDRSCLDCHAGSATNGFPGPVVRSVYPTESGLPLFQAGSFRTDDSSPISERWGGWYVTGTSGEQDHLGNIIAAETSDNDVEVEKVIAEPIDDLSEFIETSPYPSGGSSDIVALMVLEHQVKVHNALVQANLTIRQMLYRHARMREVFDEPKDTPLSETSQRILAHQAERVVEALLFKDEFAMVDEGVEGSMAFQNAFESEAKKDSEHRSLRDLRLYERLFKYRCSYMIYSDVFEQLPKLVKDAVIHRLSEILEGESNSGEFAYLGEGERERILQILTETYPGWPE